MNNSGRWVELSHDELELMWGLVDEKIKFSPYGIPKIREAELAIKVDEPYVESIADGKKIPIKMAMCKFIDDLRDSKNIIFLDWHHPSFKFSGPHFLFPDDVDFPPNGDYLFFHVLGCDEWIFCDGIAEKICFYGEVSPVLWRASFLVSG